MSHDPNNDWRILTAVIYRKPNDSKIFGSVEIDVTELEQFVNQKRKSGLKITLTHVFILAFSRAIAEAAPEINSFVRRGKIIQRKQVDVSLTVLEGNGQQLSSVKVLAAEQLNLPQLAEYLQAAIKNARGGQEARITKTKNLIARIPWPLRQWLTDLIKWLTIDWGVSLPFLGVSPESFGTFVHSNLGSLGLDVGYPALAPFSNVAMVVTQGGVSLKPAVVDGQVLPRRMITIGAALDHRVVDAAHVGRMFNHLKKVLNHPEWLMQ
jgi:pyruvate/2-oxoglutarate dehydrogenase complex dihydrolipoamide acyltransferase (E2) component